MNQIYESESLGQGVVISDGGVGRYLTVILIVADELAQVLMERRLEDTFGLGWHLSCSLIVRIVDCVIIIIISRKISSSISK